VFWGQNHTVMDGDNLTLRCGSSINKNIKGYKTYYWFWLVVDRQIGVQKFSKQNLLTRFNPYGPVRRYRPYGFRAQPKYIPELDVQLLNVNRYTTGKYVCAVATVFDTGKNRSVYTEGTNQNVVVKCKQTPNKMCLGRLQDYITYMDYIYTCLYLGKPRIESAMRSDIKLNSGDKLTLDCTSSGFPAPVITWRRVDGRPLPIRTITHNKGLLSINDVGQLDRGQYQCTSSNPYGNDTRIFSVAITGILLSTGHFINVYEFAESSKWRVAKLGYFWLSCDTSTAYCYISLEKLKTSVLFMKEEKVYKITTAFCI
jgi:hypothetical protein